MERLERRAGLRLDFNRGEGADQDGAAVVNAYGGERGVEVELTRLRASTG